MQSEDYSKLSAYIIPKSSENKSGVPGYCTIKTKVAGYAEAAILSTSTSPYLTGAQATPAATSTTTEPESDTTEPEIESPDNFDPFSGVSTVKEERITTEAGRDVLMLVDDRGTVAKVTTPPKQAMTKPIATIRGAASFTPNVSQQKKEQPFKHKKVITVEVGDVKFKLTVADARTTEHCLNLVIDLGSDGLSFIPKLGADVIVTVDGVAHKVMYLGSYVEYAELSVAIISFTKVAA